MSNLIAVLKIIYVFKLLCEFQVSATPVKYSDLSDINRYAGQYDIQSDNYFVIRYKKDGKNADFSYDYNHPNSPDKWTDMAADCGGKVQSPINIKTTSIKKAIVPAKMTATKWTEKPSRIEVENNGHTIKFEFTYANGGRPVVSLNGGVYEFAQLHYHWGDNKKSGSEHLINNRGYSMEGHAVFFNREYGTFANALNYENGIAVIGKFYEVDEKSKSMKTNFDFLNNVRDANQKYVIDSGAELFSLHDIMGSINFSYYTYHGSLTTPSCNEVVTWYVGEKPLAISSKMLSQFRKVNGHDGKMAPNFRPVQPRNGRNVLYYKV